MGRSVLIATDVDAAEFLREAAERAVAWAATPRARRALKDVTAGLRPHSVLPHDDGRHLGDCTEGFETDEEPA